MKVSYFYGVFDKTPVHVETAAIFDEIKNGKHKKIIENGRDRLSAGKKTDYDQLKKLLPAYSISCRTSGRKADTLLEHSGLLQGDFDKVDDEPAEVRDLLFKDKHVAAAFISPSGKGVKLWIKTVKDATRHKESFLAAEKYFQDKYNLALDKSCKDLTRLCFQSYDPDAKIKENAEEILLKEEIPEGNLLFDATQNTSIKNSDTERARLALENVSPEDYQTWIETGMALKELLGQSGLALWNSWSKKSSKYNPKEMAGKWDSFSGGSITGASLFHNAGNTYTFAPLDSVPKLTANRLHKDYLTPAGFVGDFAKFIVQHSEYPQPELALGASFVLTGTLMGRKVRTEKDTRTNLYIVGLADTGAGKEAARSMIKKIIEQAELGCFGAEKLTSRAAIERVVAGIPSCIFLIDEFGLYMQAINSDLAPKHLKDVASCLMEIKTSATGVYYGQDKASVKDNPRYEIVQPCLGLYATSTPDTYWDGLNSKKIKDGSMNRFLVFHGNDRPEPKDVPIVDELPGNLISFAQSLKELSINPNQSGDLKDISGRPVPQIFNYSVKAKQIFNKLRDDSRKMNGIDYAMFVRASEMAQQISLISCVCQNKSEISAEHAEYSTELVSHKMRNTVHQINKNLADNIHEKMSKRVESLIRETGEKGMSATELVAKTRFLQNKNQRKSILEDLQEARLVGYVEEKLGKAGPLTQRWFSA
ncbi:MAG: hypothetical protein HOM01_14850 [Kordiimonadaceae bacterium]|jgi:hypothetical protein|nr:hypothetical protein [Kordiimonadaceae bacterium]